MFDFIGLVGWYSKVILHVAEREAVFTDVTNDSTLNKVRGTEECDPAFRDLKCAISCDLVLRNLDFSPQFIV